MKRRTFILSSTAASVTGLAAYGYSRAQSVRRQLSSKRPALAFPTQIDARSSGQFNINAQSGSAQFVAGANSSTLGFNQSYLGPVVRVAAKGTTRANVSNSLSFPVTSHWHGLIIPGVQDGGPHQLVNPGQTWSVDLTINQPAAMTWYHSHVHGKTAAQVYGGLAGVMIVDDGKDGQRGLPSDYGQDDLVLVVQDKRLNQNGQMVYSTNMHDRMVGFVGNTMLVNGQIDAVASVPKSFVRLRFLNASNAGVHLLEFSDGRPFHIIASDTGYLEKPVAARSLRIAPAERFQVLVDFSDGGNPQLISSEIPAMSGNGPMGMMMRGRAMFSSVMKGKISILKFFVDDKLPQKIKHLPNNLMGEPMVKNLTIAATRRLQFDAGMMGGGMMQPGMSGDGMMGGAMTINGKSFDMARIDMAAKLGTFEKWIVRADMLAHPLHVHGVKFQVLSEAGRAPRLENQGWKDTVLVRDEVELLMKFTTLADAKNPYMFHCHILEHEDAGMMGQFSVT